MEKQEGIIDHIFRQKNIADKEWISTIHKFTNQKTDTWTLLMETGPDRTHPFFLVLFSLFYLTSCLSLFLTLIGLPNASEQALRDPTQSWLATTDGAVYGSRIPAPRRLQISEMIYAPVRNAATKMIIATQHSLATRVLQFYIINDY